MARPLSASNLPFNEPDNKSFVDSEDLERSQKSSSKPSTSGSSNRTERNVGSVVDRTSNLGDELLRVKPKLSSNLAEATGAPRRPAFTSIVKLYGSSKNLSAANFYSCSLSSALVMAAVGAFSKIWTNWFNSTHVVNLETLKRCIETKDRPLITVANHVCCGDDPLLWGILTWKILILKPYLMRWSMAANEICFTNDTSKRFFSLGRCVPTFRGQGVYQRAVDKCLDVLQENGWVHVFPEGKINLRKETLRLKWGVGRLIAESSTIPTVVPMWHVGMDDILPNIKPYVPRMGEKLTVLIGEPMNFERMLNEMRKQKMSSREIRARITEKIQESFIALRSKAESIHLQRVGGFIDKKNILTER